MIFYILGGIVAFLLIAITILLVYCYMHVFYSKPRKPLKADEYDIVTGGEYDKHYDQLLTWAKQTRETPHEDVEIKSFDGLTLRGKYYEYKKGAPVEIMFNGYRGNAERDMAGGVERCFLLKRNALVVNQRSCGASDGKTATFGINESKDCLKWIDFAIHKFGKDVKLIITGISMGGTTVLITAGQKLPQNVWYALADCPFTSAKDIISKVIKDMGLPPKLLYPFIKLSAKLFGKFNLDEDSPIEAVKRATIPVIILHGDKDDYVPYEMGKNLYETCASKKAFFCSKGAVHGLAFPENKEDYIKAIQDFESSLAE
ncbi:MAG: prolyl oligopeptidase family serine peptidase [Clostridia bacterium]|nr:prolyl oligopeptidase family serine peptidase [Clostridia bacterium]